MRKIVIYIMVAASVVLSGITRAETVSRKEATSLAHSFFKAAYGEEVLPPQVVWDGRQLTTQRLFVPMYIFNHQRGGYVIISAENKAYPILGYSLKRNFDRSKLTEEETSLLKKYAKEIELIRYDDRIPLQALSAWQNLREYVEGVINSPYDTQEYNALSEEKKEALEFIDRTGNQILMPSAIEFHYYDPEDYRDLTLDDLSAEEEEIPFSFYENFIKEIAKEKRDTEINFEELIAPSSPVVKSLGGGHFEISFPESVRMMRVYALNGMQVMEKYYKDTPILNLDMGVTGSGYYVGLVLSDSGKIYGFKLYR